MLRGRLTFFERDADARLRSGCFRGGALLLLQQQHHTDAGASGHWQVLAASRHDTASAITIATATTCCSAFSPPLSYALRLAGSLSTCAAVRVRTPRVYSNTASELCAPPLAPGTRPRFLEYCRSCERVSIRE